MTNTQLDRWTALARRWCESHPPPVGSPMGSRTPRHEAEHVEWLNWSKAFHASGLATMNWPREMGGAAVDAVTDYAVAEVLAAAGMPLPLTDIGLSMVAPAIHGFGDETQRRRHLGPIATGEVIWTQLFSEPEAGSDLASLRTAAAPGPDGRGGWIVNGQKVWSTYAHIADWGFLLARTGSREERHRGLTVFLAPMDAPGVTIRPIREMTGDADYNEVFFEDVRLDDSAMLGSLGGGWAICMALMATERHHTGAQTANLLAELDRMATIVATLPDEHPVRAPFADAAARAGALRGLLDAELADGAELVQKIVFSELNVEVHRLALELLSDPQLEVPRGWRARWQDNYLYSRAYTISGGANEVLRNVLAKRHLGLT